MIVLLLPVALLIGLLVLDILALRFGVDSRDLDPNARDLRPTI